MASELELNRELTYTTDPVTKTWRTFRPRPGARIDGDSVWRRYAPFIGIPISELVRVGPSRPASVIPNAVFITYQQMHLGYPVGGYGYTLQVKDGLLIDGLGKSMPGLPSQLPNPISRERALAIALARAAPKGPPYPWTTEPKRWKAPAQDLVLGATRFEPKGSDFRLVWEFSFSSTGLSGVDAPGSITIDAETGAVIATTPGLIR